MISGLAENRVALLAKFHHAAIDGVGGRELMTNLARQRVGTGGDGVGGDGVGGDGVHAALGAGVLQDLSDFAMPALAAQASRAAAAVRVADVVNPPFNLVISNVPGPRTPLLLGDAQMAACHPVSAIAGGIGLHITVQSYRNNLDFGLLACRELVPDLWKLTGHIADAVNELSIDAATATGVAPGLAGYVRRGLPNSEARRENGFTIP